MSGRYVGQITGPSAATTVVRPRIAIIATKTSNGSCGGGGGGSKKKIVVVKRKKKKRRRNNNARSRDNNILDGGGILAEEEARFLRGEDLAYGGSEELEDEAEDGNT